jgi:hypothetical protein
MGAFDWKAISAGSGLFRQAGWHYNSMLIGAGSAGVAGIVAGGLRGLRGGCEEGTLRER